MRLDEFANAEDQLALWKLINDNVWQAIETQRQQQAREAQAKAAKAKLMQTRLAASLITAASPASSQP